MRPSVNQSPVIYHSDHDGVTLLCEGELFPVISPEPVKIEKFKVADDAKKIEFKIRSKHFGSGKLTLRMDSKDDSFLTKGIVSYFFSLLDANQDTPIYVAGHNGDVLHYVGCNHCPIQSERVFYPSIEIAMEDGHRLCTACFSPIRRIPDYLEEMQLGQALASQVNSQSLTVQDDARQRELNDIGAMVLDNWPYILRGYSYRFSLIDSDVANAISCPGGYIFVSTALFNLCETKHELEAVIAHEVAHVEMRHGLRQLRLAKRNAMIAGVFTGLLAAATSQEDSGTQIAGAMASLIVSVALDIALFGYSQEFERESDAYAVNYLERKYGERARSDYADIMLKLQYLEECENQSPHVPSKLSTHPDLKDRVGFVDGAQINFFDPPPSFVFKNEEGETCMVVSIDGFTEYNFCRIEERKTRSVRKEVEVQGYEQRAFIRISTTNGLGDEYELKHLHFRIGDNWYKIDNKEDTIVYPSHEVSMCLIRESSKPINSPNLHPKEIRLPKEL